MGFKNLFCPSPKTKFIDDANLSMPDKIKDKDRNLINLKDLLDEEVTDDKLITYVKNKNHGIYTKYIRCKLQSLIEGITVRYVEQETDKEYKLKAQILD